jgi:hypothetical protein
MAASGNDFAVFPPKTIALNKTLPVGLITKFAVYELPQKWSTR